MRSFTFPLPTPLAGFVAALVGYASSAAIIQQAAASAGATPGQAVDWMTALDLTTGISTLVLGDQCEVPMFTVWPTSGAVLLVNGLQGITLAGVVGMFISTNMLIVLRGVTGLFTRLMKIIPHSLAVAMLAGILLRFGLQAFVGLQEHLLLRGSMFTVWLFRKTLWPRFAVVVALVVGALIVAASRDVSRTAVPLAFVALEWIALRFTPALLLSVSLSFFLVTVASQDASGFATLQAPSYTVPVSALFTACEGLTLLLTSFGIYSIYITAVTAAICQDPEAHPDPQQRQLAAVAAGGLYLLAGLFNGSITTLMSTLPTAWIQTLVGLALLGTADGNLFQAVHQASERDTTVLAFLVTASGVTPAGIEPTFWGMALGGVSYGVLSALRRPQLERRQAGDRSHLMAEMAGGAKAAGQCNLR